MKYVTNWKSFLRPDPAHCPPERMRFNVLEGDYHCDPADPTRCFPPSNILKKRPYCDNDDPVQGEGLWIGPEVSDNAKNLLNSFAKTNRLSSTIEQLQRLLNRGHQVRVSSQPAGDKKREERRRKKLVGEKNPL